MSTPKTSRHQDIHPRLENPHEKPIVLFCKYKTCFVVPTDHLLSIFRMTWVCHVCDDTNSDAISNCSKCRHARCDNCATANGVRAEAFGKRKTSNIGWTPSLIVDMISARRQGTERAKNDRRESAASAKSQPEIGRLWKL